MTTFKIFDADGVPRGIEVDQKNRIVIKQAADHSINKGEDWYFRNFLNLSGEGDKNNIHVRLPKMVDGIGTLDCRMSWRIASSAEVSITLIAVPTIIAKGTPIAIRNRNVRYLSSPYYLRWYVGATWSGGIEVQKDIIGSGKYNEAGQSSLGEFSVPENSLYVMEFEKQAAGDCWVSYEFVWREIILNGTVEAITTTTTSTTV